MNNDEICKRVEYLRNERKGTVESEWDLIDRFVVPRRGDFYVSLNSEGEVDWRRREIYDSTAIYAAQTLAAAMSANLTSLSQRWFDMRFRRTELNDQKPAAAWLEECANIIYGALDDANFDIEIAESYTDLVAFGSSVLTEEIDDEGDLVFTAIPIRESYFEENHKKQPYRVYRILQWTPVQIMAKFGDKVPSKVKEASESPSSSSQRMDVVFCIYPRETVPDLDLTRPVAPQARPFGYKYILKDTHELLGEEGGYYEMPAFVARWRTVAGSRWGKSPAMDALGDILTLNQTKEATLEAAGKAIDPPMAVEESALSGNVNLERAGLTTMTDINGIKPLESGSNFDVSALEVQWLSEAINAHFQIDKLVLKESPQMTATEVNVRYQQMQQVLGSTLDRLKTDLLKPLINTTFALLYRAGKLPQMPEGLGAADLDIDYVGPLPKAQQAAAANNILQWMADIAQLVQIYPEAREMVDVEAAMRRVAELRGIPAMALKSKQEIDAARRKAQQQQQANQALQTAGMAGEAMEAMGKGAQAMRPQ